MKTFLPLFPVLILLSACGGRYEWSATGADGVTLAQAHSECRARAAEYSRYHAPSAGSYAAGPGGYAPENAGDLERREIERCLSGRGFKRVKAD